MSVFVAIFGLLLLVAIHELGHFTAAKATGMRALRFYLGFPPAVVKRTWRGTEYGIGAIPLGGFVKITGRSRPSSFGACSGASSGSTRISTGAPTGDALGPAG